MNAQLSSSYAGAPLEARGLSKSYDGQSVLIDLSLKVQQGSVLGLIGRNGAGKSTLLRCLLGLVEPGGGQAFVFGEPALSMSDRCKTRLAYVPQQPDALGWLEVGEMLDFVGRFYPRWDRAFVDSMIARWDLPRRKQLVKLSPGERQRVALIRALASQPELLVLDEPASGLDPVARRELLRQIVTRAAEFGTTVVFSTHIVSDLERVASDVAFLHRGRLLINAPLDDFKERIARAVIPALLAPSVAGKVDGELARRKLSDGGLNLVVERAASGDWPAIALAPGVVREAMGLEDLFIEVVE